MLKRCTQLNKGRKWKQMIWLWWVLKGVGVFAEVAETATTASKLPTATVRVGYPWGSLVCAKGRSMKVKTAANMIGQSMLQAKVVLGRLLENRWKMGDWEGAAGDR